MGVVPTARPTGALALPEATVTLLTFTIAVLSATVGVTVIVVVAFDTLIV